jgi:two-component system CheB/CheR fusion protein
MEAKKKKKSADAVEPTLPSHYVGIGASAGGLEAIEQFFTHMPTDSGMAFIVVQHLSPDYKSLMVELLSKKTDMPVSRAEEGMLVEANHVYLIPPKKNLTIFHGRLLLADQEHVRVINLPIDIFLRSLAEDQAEKTVAIILSGTGSDGMRGVRTVKECGGIVMVQTEESAKFDGMPRSAISTGLADFILPPEKMPGQLLAFAKHPYASNERSEILLSDEDGLTRIFSLLRERCKIDFTYYKPSTVTRRIERRMTINQAENIKDYLSYMLNYPSEVVALYRELLIGVTCFFRDQEAFDYLAAEVLPEIIKNAGKREIRFWVAACSTGEEAYSLAILARECMDQLGLNREIKIFATDIDRDAVQFAATGSYPESIAADLSAHYLSKYFHKRDDNFQISRQIREMVVFAQHNLIKDPPFTNIDLLTCRNILIYLQPVLQRKVMEFFNFSLANGGFLFLGSSETTGEMGDLFEPLHQKFKIYRTRGRVLRASEVHRAPSITDTRYRQMKGQFSAVKRLLGTSDDEHLVERFLQAAIEDFLPLALIVNEQLELLRIVGDADGYLKLPSGYLVNDITKMAIKEISIPLTTGVQKAFRQNQEQRFSNIRINRLGNTLLIDLLIRPLPCKKHQEPLVAIFIREVRQQHNAPELAPQTYDLSQETEERLRDMEQELQFTRENLQATIEELETSNEELQATNEELLASNEELQSTNEELQSTNEELFTVNAEYQSKIIELTELHNDVDNLLSATQIGQLLLDENLEVRRFSRNITNIFKLLDSDIGRPITHITHLLQDIDPVAVVRQVQRTNQMAEIEVATRDNKWLLMRVVPYAVAPGAFAGTVLTFVDITLIKQAQEEVRNSQQLFAAIANHTPALVWMSDPDKNCTWFNDTWLKFTGRTLEQEYGTGWTEGVHPEDMEHCLKTYTTAFERRQPFSMEYRLRHFDGEYRWLLDEGAPRYGENQEFLGYIGFCLDITERKEMEARLIANEQKCRQHLAELQAAGKTL